MCMNMESPSVSAEQAKKNENGTPDCAKFSGPFAVSANNFSSYDEDWQDGEVVEKEGLSSV